MSSFVKNLETELKRDRSILRYISVSLCKDALEYNARRAKGEFNKNNINPINNEKNSRFLEPALSYFVHYANGPPQADFLYPGFWGWGGWGGGVVVAVAVGCGCGCGLVFSPCPC